MKTIFFGTPDFAVPTLAAMVEAGFPPTFVVSQPARPVGRKRQLQDPAVVRWARGHGFEVLQPERVRRRDFMARMREASPDVAVVVAFGQIFRRPLLELPRLGCINVHASLLPRWRGAAPIHAAIAHGEAVTGVTTMQMDVGLDSGPTLLQDELDISPQETTLELTPRLAVLGARLLVRTLDQLGSGGFAAEAQNDSLVTYAPRLSKEDGRVDWHQSAVQIYNRWRALVPWPGSFTELRGKVVKLLRGEPREGYSTEVPGTFLALVDGWLHVACGGGTICAFEELQVAGKKPVQAVDFVNGERLAIGECFSQSGECFSQPGDAISSCRSRAKDND
jgi:methionyl-tRNA formyltransferase